MSKYAGEMGGVSVRMPERESVVSPSISRQKKAAAQQRSGAGHSRRCNPRHRSHLFYHRPHELLAFLRLHLQRPQIYARHQKMIRFKAEVNALRPLHAADEQSSAHECNESERDLAHHQ